MPTIKQIAHKAGVSPTTVSNVINGRTSKVSPIIRDKIEAILKEENYVTNMAANILSNNNSKIVSVIIFSETRMNETQWEDPFSYTVMGNIESELRKYGYFMMVHTTHDKHDIVRLAKSWKSAGIILLGVPESVHSIWGKGFECPLVHVDSNDLNEAPNYLRVGLDDRKAGYEITKYLCSMGHSKFLYISNSPERMGVDFERFSGCKDALDEVGISFPDERFHAVSRDKNERLSLYKSIMDEPRLYTALIFGSDYYAVEAITYFQEIGIDVPSDISVTGFDDNIFSRIITPKLTTVHQDVGEKGKVAVDMLVKAINGETLTETNVILPFRLIIRDSVSSL